MFAKAMVMGIALLASSAASAGEQDAAGRLFSPVEAVQWQRPVAALDSGPRPLLEQEPLPRSSTAGTIRSRSVRVDFGQLRGVRDLAAQGDAASLRLNLFADVELDAVIERTGDTRYGYSLSGRIEGQPHGAVTLVVLDDIVAGSIHSRQGTFVLAARNGAIHTVREVTGGFLCGVDGTQVGATEHLHPPGRKLASAKTHAPAASNAAAEDDGAEVDVLVLFTEAALDFEGNLDSMRAGIDLAFAWTNDAYRAGGVDMRLNLVAAVMIDYQESSLHPGQGVTNQRTDLDRLIHPADGFMDSAHALRDQYAADIVHLVVDQPGGGGVGSVLKSESEDPAASAFSISNSVATPNAALLAHETGHVMGLLHDRYTQFGNAAPDYRSPVPPYAHGYVNQRALRPGAPDASRWRTIMAYETQCRDEGVRCPELPRFSNPDQTYPAEGGDPLGVQGDEPTLVADGPANAVRHLNEVRSLIAGFRPSSTRCRYALSQAEREVTSSGGEFSVELDSEPGCAWSAAGFGDFIAIESDREGSGPGTVSFRVQPNDGAARVGYVTVAGQTLTVYQSGQVAPADVCARTPQVRDAIASASGLDCEAITEFDLLDVKLLDLRSKRITTLDSDDFTGLSRLTELLIGWNELEEIPAGAFADLVRMTRLQLRENSLRTVPEAVQGLQSLQYLNLFDNAIASLSGGALAGLPELRTLLLDQNKLTALPDRAFAGLPKLHRLELAHNQIGDVRKEAFEGIAALGHLDLRNNPLTRLREDAFSNVRDLYGLHLDETLLQTIPTRTFTDFSRLNFLTLSNNRFSSLSADTIPGIALRTLDLAGNGLQAIPAEMFRTFTSGACFAGNLGLDLTGNPGSPFPLAIELKRVDAGLAAPGPAKVVVRVREGAPWSMSVKVVAEGASTFSRQLELDSGTVESEPFEVGDAGTTHLRIAAAPRVPGSYKGIRIALGSPLRLFALGNRELGLGGGRLEIDLDDALGGDGAAYTYAAESSDPALATVSVEKGTLLINANAEGTITVTVTATDGDGKETVRSFDVRVVSRLTDVAYMPPALDEGREGFVRVVNHSAKAGEVSLEALDDEGMAHDPQTLSMPANAARHFNSGDLERGNAAKGLSGGVGRGHGGWRLAGDSDLDIEVLSYIRTTDGFVTSMHDLVPNDAGIHRVAFFNPGSNYRQESLLRVLNPGDSAASVTVRGVDDLGAAAPSGAVGLSIPPRAARTISAAELEGGAAGLDGSLGDGEGKWRLEVGADVPVRVMSLLATPTGHLTNLSTDPGTAGAGRSVPFFPAASDPLGRQGFVRVVNQSNEGGTVSITAFDGAGRDHGPVTLTLDALQTVHFNSGDLEDGNAGKGLPSGVGRPSQGDWRLELASDLDIKVLSYIRTSDGFVTSMHDLAPSDANVHRVAFFNPGSNYRQESLLRIVNPGGSAASISIRGVDDRGVAAPGGMVRLSVPPRASRTFTAAELEGGAVGLDGSLGDGEGKWRLEVEADVPILVMSLLATPTGHLTNLSSRPVGQM